MISTLAIVNLSVINKEPV